MFIQYVSIHIFEAHLNVLVSCSLYRGLSSIAFLFPSIAPSHMPITLRLSTHDDELWRRCVAYAPPRRYHQRDTVMRSAVMSGAPVHLIGSSRETGRLVCGEMYDGYTPLRRLVWSIYHEELLGRGCVTGNQDLRSMLVLVGTAGLVLATISGCWLSL
jgi:hypothetical protein